MMLKLLKIISYPLLMLFLVFNAYCVYKSGYWAVMHPKVYMWFAIGIMAWVVLKGIFRKNLDFLETFTHELTHTIVSLMFFQKIHSFHATNGEGGVMYHSGKMTNNIFISLAPYCLPIYTFALLIIRLWITSKSLWIFEILIGLSVGFHFITIKKDISPRQPDIKGCGIFFSYLFIWAFILFHLALIVWSMHSGIDGAFVKYWQNLVYVWEVLIH
jgi:hypothetical protein